MGQNAQSPTHAPSTVTKRHVLQARGKEMAICSYADMYAEPVRVGRPPDMLMRNLYTPLIE